MWIFDVRVKIFSSVLTQKWVRLKCPWNVISLLFMYNNLVKFSKNLQNFQKRRLRRRFGRFAPENPKTLQSKPPSGRNPAIETPPQGVRDPIISSAWTPKRAWTGSYASLLPIIEQPKIYWTERTKIEVGGHKIHKKETPQTPNLDCNPSQTRWRLRSK